jgi:hypothetical protein
LNGGTLTNWKIRYNVAYDTNWEYYRTQTYPGRSGAFWTNGGIGAGEIAYNLVYNIWDNGSNGAVLVQCNVGAVSWANNTFVMSQPTNTNALAYGSWGGSGTTVKNSIIIGSNLGASPPSGSSNNIRQSTNPGFIDGTYPTLNFHLIPTSSAVNGGVSLGFTKDLDGNPIVGLPDVGCYEYQP